ncbi:MAG: hypothetical protein Q4D20_04415, partial [Clostridia bacterium]|nr:hypothetical protein [Clostridia bacterium]
MSDIKKDPSAFYDDDFVKKKTEEPASSNETGKIDEINEILESVGISPIAEEKPQEKETPRATEKTIRISDNEKTKVIPDDGKTKHFSLKNEPPEIKKTKKEKSGQLLLDGYDDETKPKVVSQSSVEKQLKKTRQNLIDNFRVLSKDIADEAILE